jgi:hypothetical protein
MAAPGPTYSPVGTYLLRPPLLPVDNPERNETDNKDLDIVVRTLIRKYPTLFGVSTCPPGVANEQRAIDIPGVIKCTLTVSTAGFFTALVPMGEPLAEKIAREDLAGNIGAFLAFRDDDNTHHPDGAVRQTVITSPHAPLWPYRVTFQYLSSTRKKYLMFTTSSVRSFVHFLDTLLGASLALVIAHQNYRPPCHERFRRI